MFVLLVEPKPELSSQALPGTGAELHWHLLPKAAWCCKATKAKSWALKDFSTDIVLQAERPSWGSFLWTLSTQTWETRKVKKRHFVPLAAPCTWGLQQGWQEGPGSVSSPLLPEISLSGMLKLLESVWGVTLAPDWTVYLYSLCHAFSGKPPQTFHQERKSLTLIIKLITEKPNEPELSSHPATHPAHVQDGKQLQHMPPETLGATKASNPRTPRVNKATWVLQPCPDEE